MGRLIGSRADRTHIRVGVLSGQTNRLPRALRCSAKSAFLKEPLQNQSAIVLLISRRVSQGDRACFGFSLKQLDQIIVFLEFLLVTQAELILTVQDRNGTFSRIVEP